MNNPLHVSSSHAEQPKQETIPELLGNSSGEETQKEKEVEEINTSPDVDEAESGLRAMPKPALSPGKEKKMKEIVPENPRKVQEKQVLDVPGGGEGETNAEDDQAKTFLERLSSVINTEIDFFNLILEFHADNKKYPFSDSDSFQDFYDFWFIDHDTPDCLLMEAIQSLKRKYQKMAVKVRENFGHFQPSDLEVQAFDLAKKIWNDIDDTGIEESVNDEKFIGEPHLPKYPFLNESLKLHRSISDDTTSKGLELIGSSKIKELKDEWEIFWEEKLRLTLKQNKLMLKQDKLSLKKEELVSNQEKLFTDAIESSSSSPQTPADS